MVGASRGGSPTLVHRVAAPSLRWTRRSDWHLSASTLPSFRCRLGPDPLTARLSRAKATAPVPSAGNSRLQRMRLGQVGKVRLECNARAAMRSCSKRGTATARTPAGRRSLTTSTGAARDRKGAALSRSLRRGQPPRQRRERLHQVSAHPCPHLYRSGLAPFHMCKGATGAHLRRATSTTSWWHTATPSRS
jgi:hypothetical protein